MLDKATVLSTIFPIGDDTTKGSAVIQHAFSHHLKRLLGDGAYNDAALQSYLEQYRSLELLAPRHP